MATTTTFPGCTSCCGGGDVTLCCCPDDPIPTTLTLTVTGRTSCACLAASCVLTWDGTSFWGGVLTGCDSDVVVELRCIDNGGGDCRWRLVVDSAEYSKALFPLSTCSPLALYFAAISPGTTGCSFFNCVVTA